MPSAKTRKSRVHEGPGVDGIVGHDGVPVVTNGLRSPVSVVVSLAE